MPHSSPSNRPLFVIRLLALFVVGFNVAGNYFLSVGMRSMGALIPASPLAYLQVFSNGWIMLGVAFLAGWLVSSLSLLSWADLTYVLPMTSMSYVLTAIVASLSLHEHLSIARWAGTGLIFCGVLVVGGTRPRTAPPTREALL